MRITEVAVRVGDPEAGAAALAELLGLAVEPGPVVRIGWTVVRPVAPEGEGFDHLAILVPGDAYDAAKRWILERATVIPDDGEIDVVGPQGWDSTSVYFDGPGGVVLELIAHHGHRLRRDATFPDALLGVCEVGIAVPDVPAAIEVSGLPVFAGTASPTFAAVGDRDGRLILVPPGRVWFPTSDRRAELAPVSVTADDAPPREVLLGASRFRTA